MTLCLCMIVKNEAHVIERCLRSVLAVGIDYWVIADTGSTDGTQALVRSLLRDVPGELHEDPWVDFAHNRTLVCRRARARADWLIWLDADGTLEGTAKEIPPECDAYAIPLTIVDTKYAMVRILRGSMDWEYEYPIHEHVVLTDRTTGYYPKLHDKSFPDGARSRNPNKWADDAAYIETLERTPRNVFHLAQSYREAGMFREALRAYVERAEMGPQESEEVWLARLYAGRCFAMLGDTESARDTMLATYNSRPKRAETLVDLAKLHRGLGQHGLSYLFAGQAARMTEPKREMFAVETNVYRWTALEELALACGELGMTKTARSVVEELLRRDPPAQLRRDCEENLRRLEERNGVEQV